MRRHHLAASGINRYTFSTAIMQHPSSSNIHTTVHVPFSPLILLYRTRTMIACTSVRLPNHTRPTHLGLSVSLELA